MTPDLQEVIAPGLNTTGGQALSTSSALQAAQGGLQVPAGTAGSAGLGQAITMDRLAHELELHLAGMQASQPAAGDLHTELDTGVSVTLLQRLCKCDGLAAGCAPCCSICVDL